VDPVVQANPVSFLRKRSSLAGLAAAMAVIFAIALAAVSVDSSPAAAATALSPSSFQGANWADPGDNFQLGPVVPSGLSTSDTYAQVYQTATNVLKGFQAFGANTVRLPVNIGSVLSTYPDAPNCTQAPSTWWGSYQGAIDAATALNMKVILSYWEGQSNSNTGCTNNANSGQVYNTTTWQSMWSTIIAKYGSNSLVYFEPMNEPWGYSASQWISLAAQWLADNPSVPASRVLIDGTGYAGNVTAECASSSLNGTYLVLHYYGSSGNESYTQRVSDLTTDIGSCSDRTVMDEFGAPMTTYAAEGVTGSLNYDGANNTTGSADENNYLQYLQAMTDTVRNLGIGAVYWPGLKSGDPYSLTTVSGSGTALSLSVVDQSGIDRLKYAWGEGSAVPQTSTTLVGAGSSKCLDVPGQSQTAGTYLDLWSCNGGSNQIWVTNDADELVVYGNKCLDGYNQGTIPGTLVDIAACTGAANQEWEINSSGQIIEAQSGLCLDVHGASTSNGAATDLWTCNGGSNQKWAKG
jgi:Ricin-type beta-trefoil lectin domain/Cellulase (glycosyl hydrolase family 5)